MKNHLQVKAKNRLPVGDVAGVVDPDQLVEALTPPRGQLQPHVEGAVGVGGWVPPAEPAPLVFGHLLHAGYKHMPFTNMFNGQLKNCSIQMK